MIHLRSVIPVIATTLMFILTFGAIGAEKKRDWQMGKVLDSEHSRYFAGTVGNANTTGTAQANGNYGTYSGNTNQHVSNRRLQGL